MAASLFMPDVTVEIAFTTTPYDASPVWVDVSAYVEAQDGVQISRGRADEISEVQPSKLTLTLDNTDGRFTPGYASGAYYPNVKKGKKIRVTAVWASVTYRRFTGYIDEWPVAWPDGSSQRSTVLVTASSRTARVARAANLFNVITQEILADTPAIYFPLGEPTLAVQAGNASNTTRSSLTIAQAGSGGTLTFGTGTGPGTDALPTPTFTRASLANGKYLTGTTEVPVTDLATAATHFALEAWFTATGTIQGGLVQTGNLCTGGGTGALLTVAITTGILVAVVWDNGTIVVNMGSAAAANDGLVHHAVFKLDVSGTGTATPTLILDGVATTAADIAMPVNGGTTYIPSRFSSVGINIGSANNSGSLAYTPLTGTVAHAAVYGGPTEVTSARFAVHYTSGTTGFSGESSDTRIKRLARYADYATADVSAEAGSSTSIAFVDTTDQAPLTLMTDVAKTEYGVLFDDRDGVLKFHARAHRYNAASGFTLNATTQDLEGSLQPKLDDFGLLNDVTASRTGGITVRAVDTASVLDYGYYRDTLALLTTSDDEVRDAAYWRVGTYSTPLVRVPNATVQLATCASATVASVLAAEIGDRLTLAGLPVQAPAASIDFFIEGYTETVTDESWLVDLNLSPTSQSSVWLLDSTTYSVLDTTTRLGY